MNGRDETGHDKTGHGGGGTDEAVRHSHARPHSRHHRQRHRGGLSRWVIAGLGLAGFAVLRLVNPMPAESLRDQAIGRAMEMARLVPLSSTAAVDQAKASVVVVVDIDEATIARYGRWPLPRNEIARLVETIRAARPAVLGFAYVFTGADRGSDADRRLAKTLDGAPVVLGTALFRARPSADHGGVPVTSARLDTAAALQALPHFARLMPIPDLFLKSSVGAGLLSIQLSHDGQPRRLPTLVRFGDGIIASLPVEMLRVAAGATPLRVSGGPAGVRAITVGTRRIATDPNGMVWFNADRGEPLRRVSALDVLDGRMAPSVFRGGFVLIGSTAAGLASEYVSADGGLLPGLDALAHALASLLDGRTYHYPVGSLLDELALALLLTILALAADRWTNGWVFLGLGLSLIAGLWAGTVFVLARVGQIVDPGLLSVFAVTLYGGLLINRYRLARREARAVIALQEKEVTTLREDTARVAVAAANPRLSIALSHELRQPLAAARNYLGAIRRLAGREKADGVDKLASYADEASRQITSMTEMMNELSEIVRGDLTLMREERLGDILIKAVSTAMSAIGDPEVRLISHIPDPPAPVLLNRRQIQLVVSNLARNAIEAPRPGHELRIVLDAREVEDDMVEISFADNAAGIPEGIRDRIFRRFESSKSAGSGVGLPLCRDIVEAHGGEIWFDSEVGKGTTFYFTLRRAG